MEEQEDLDEEDEDDDIHCHRLFIYRVLSSFYSCD